MGNIKFSIISAAKRTYAYEDCYSNLADQQDIPFEMIFVGPNPPKNKMPDNFKYIKTSVKPSQCLEIAARKAVGEYLLVGGDDLVYPPNFFERLNNYTLRLDTDKVIISFRFRCRNEVADAGMIYKLDMPLSPVIGVAPAVRRDVWNKLGGLDRRFFGSWADMDMQMRCYEYGMNPFITPDIIIGEKNYYKKEKKRQSLLHRSGKTGRVIINSFWVHQNGSMSKKRLLPVQSFNDKDIRVKDQN